MRSQIFSRLRRGAAQKRFSSSWGSEHCLPIKGIAVYQCDLPLNEGSYNWSGGKSVSVFDSTVVKIECEDGTIGWGECTPLGPFYLPSYAAGCRTGIKELAPLLL